MSAARKVGAWMLIACIVAGLGVVARGPLHEAVPPTATNEQTTSQDKEHGVVRPPAMPATTARSPGSNAPIGDTADTSPSNLITAARSSVHQPVDQPAETVEENDRPSRIATSGNPDDLEPASVIGRPFPLSASVEEDCERFRDEICTGLRRTLDQMAKEPRDPRWASRIEEVLRNRMITLEPGKFVIRNIECRSSACAVEVESRIGSFSGGSGSYEFDKANGIYLDQISHGYERDGNLNVTVTVATYVREK